MAEDKYISKKINPIIEDLKAVWKLDDSDEWLKEFKETLKNLVDKSWQDGFSYSETERDLEKDIKEMIKEYSDFCEIHQLVPSLKGFEDELEILC